MQTEKACSSTLRGHGWEVAPSFCLSHLTEHLHNLPVSVPRCPDGMVEAEPCTPWSDRKCVKQTPGTQASGEAPVPGDPVPTSPGLPTAPSPSSGSSQEVIGIAAGCVLLVLVLLVARPCYHWRHSLPGEVVGSDGEALARAVTSLTSCVASQTEILSPPSPKSSCVFLVCL